MLENKAQYEELILEAPYEVIFLMDESIDVKLDLVGASDVSLGELSSPKFDGKHFSQFYSRYKGALFNSSGPRSQ